MRECVTWEDRTSGDNTLPGPIVIQRLLQEVVQNEDQEHCKQVKDMITDKHVSGEGYKDLKSAEDSTQLSAVHHMKDENI